MAVTTPSIGSKRTWIPWRARKHRDTANRSEPPPESNPAIVRDAEVPGESANEQLIAPQSNNAQRLDSSVLLSDNHQAEKTSPEVTKNLPFLKALSDHLATLDVTDKGRLAGNSQPSLQELFKEIENLNETHKSESRYRQCVAKMNNYFAWLPNALSLWDPVIASNQPAAIAVGVVKAIVLFACRSYSSFEALSLEIDRLSNCFETLAVYGEKCSGLPQVYNILVDTYKDLFMFYGNVRGLFVKGGKLSRGLKFGVSTFQDQFGDIISKIERHSQTLQEISQALILAQSEEGRKQREAEISRHDSEELQKILSLLPYNPFEHIQSKLDSRIQGTCQWVLNDNDYLNWKNSDQTAMLTLTGDIGFGKTMVTAYLVETLDGLTRSTTGKDSFLVCSFFCDNKDSTRNNAVSVFQGLLYEIIRKCADAAEHVIKWYRGHDQRDFQNYSELLHLFLSTLEKVRSCQIFIIVDALDECDENGINAIISGFSTISNRRDLPIIKVMLSYRPLEPIIQQLSQKNFRMRLDRNTSTDFQLIVRSGLSLFQQRTRCSDETRSKLETAFLNKGSGCPLWAKLMLRYLDGSYSSNMIKLLELVQEFPPGLDNVYLAILSKIKPQNRREASIALRMLAVAIKPLKLEQLNQALAANQFQDSNSADVIQIQEQVLQDVNSLMEDDFQRHITSILGPFIRIHGGRVDLFHQSAKEFVLGQLSREFADGFQSPPLVNGQNLLAAYTCSPERANGIMARCCIKYLNLRDFGMPSYGDAYPESMCEMPFQTFFAMGSDESLPSEATSPVAQKNPSDRIQSSDSIPKQIQLFDFYEYASRYWMDHLAASSDTEVAELSELAMALSKAESTRLHNWAEQYRQRLKAESWIKFPEDHELDPLVVASYLGQSQILANRVRMNTLNEMKDNTKSACIWAARMGRLEILKSLLESRQESMCDVQERGELFFCAAEYGSSSIIHFLLQGASPAQVSFLQYGTSTPLSIAVSKGFSDITKMLLTASGDEIDPLQSLFCAVPISGRTRTQETPELTASRKTILESLVRSTKIDLSYRNPRDGKTVLSWAAISGCVDSVDVILNSGRQDDVCRLLCAEPDNAGCSPILYAARWGHMEVLKLLCKQEHIDKKQLRPILPEDETPLAAAARNGHVDAVKFLAEVDPESIDLCDLNVGMSPLSLAVHSESGGAAVASVLLATGQVDVESKSYCGSTPLRYAVVFARVDMIRVLVVEGKADTTKVFCVENGLPKLLAVPCATWEAPRVLEALSSLVGSRTEGGTATP